MHKVLRTELERHSVKDEEESYNDYDGLAERPKMTMMMRRRRRRKMGRRERKGKKKRRGREEEEKGGREREEETRHSREGITPM